MEIRECEVIMIIDCQDRHGEAFSLKYSGKKYGNGAGWASVVMDAMYELKDIFRPVTADLLLCCYYKNNWFEDWDINPTQPAWHLQTDIPKNIYDIPAWKKAIENKTQQINKETLTTWVENALNQESPRPDTHIVEINSLDFRAVRARIFDEKPFEGRNTFVVDHFRMGKYEYPLRRIDDELWVYSPIPEVFSKPAFHVRTNFDMSTMRIYLYWNWWTKNSPEKEALEEAMLNIINTGQWKLFFLDEYLKMSRLEELVVDSIIG